MYKSPIEIVHKIEQQIVQQQEENVIQAIHKMGVNVDKDELLKALAYDREQYNKGYEDGVIELAGRLKATAVNLRYIGEHVSVYDLDDILKEMVGEDK